MSRIKLEYSTDKAKLFFSIPSITYNVLETIAYNTKKILQRKYMAPAGFIKERDKRGRRTASYSIKKDTAMLVAYPLNLYERGHVNRGKKIAGLKVFSSKLPVDAEAISNKVLTRYVNNLTKGLK